MAIPFVFLGSNSAGTIFTTYGKVNGLEVNQSDLNSANNSVNQRLIDAYGEDFSPEMIPEDALLEMVKQEIISEKTLLSQTRDLGINVSEEKAKTEIMTSPNFQVDGQFDQIAFEAAVRTQGYTPNDYISTVQEGMAKNYLIDAIASSFFTLESEVQDIANLLEQEREISFTKIDFNTLKESIEVDLTEAQAFYNDNSIKFYSNEARSMKFIKLENNKYRSKVDIPENYLEEAYLDYSKRISMRSEKRASHIMVDQMNYSSKDEALNKIVEAQKALLSGSSFADIVLSYSEDLISKDLEGDIGFSSGEVFPEEFENALADMSIGDISDIVFSDATNSFHILKLTEINKEDVKSFDEMKEPLLEELISAESIALMDEDKDIIDNGIIDNLSIEEIALSLDLDINTSNKLTLQNFNFDIKSPIIAQTLFSFPQDINIPEVIDLDDSIMVMSLDAVEESSLMSFETVVEKAIELVKNDKAASLSLTLQESIKKDEVIDKSLDYISSDTFIGVKRYSSLFPQEVLQLAFISSPNEQFVANSKNGDSYVMTINAVNNPDKDFLESMVDEYKEFNRGQVSNKVATLVFDELRNSAKVNLQNL
jgi:peptidyl-prolyl cis-trans isomerase D